MSTVKVWFENLPEPVVIDFPDFLTAVENELMSSKIVKLRIKGFELINRPSVIQYLESIHKFGWLFSDEQKLLTDFLIRNDNQRHLQNLMQERNALEAKLMSVNSQIRELTGETVKSDLSGMKEAIKILEMEVEKNERK